MGYEQSTLGMPGEHFRDLEDAPILRGDSIRLSLPWFARLGGNVAAARRLRASCPSEALALVGVPNAA